MSKSSAVVSRRNQAFTAAIEPLERRALLTATQLDLTFGQGGYNVSAFGTDTIYDMAVQPNGDVIAVGTGSAQGTYSQNDFNVVRYHANGAVDTTFGDNGIARADFFGFFDRAYSVALLPGGKMLVADSYTGAKDKVAEQKEARATRKELKRRA